MKCLVIVLENCRLDYFGCYGNDWLSTPAIDRLASESVVFDQHFADCPTPAGARRGWRTGRYGIASQSDRRLAEALWERGVLTAMLADERSGSLGSQFAQAWEWQHWLRRRRLPELEQETLLGGTVQTAIEWLQQHGSRKNWLLWLEISALVPNWDSGDFDADSFLSEPDNSFQPWFDPPLGGGLDAAALDRLRNTYGGIIGGVDQWLGQLLEFLRGTGLYDDTMLILTSDTGMPLGDHGVVGSDPPWLHEELVHLPLLIHLPANEAAGRRVHQFTQPVDLAATLLDACGSPAAPEVHGHSLLAVAKGEPRRIREYACSWARRAGWEEWSLRSHHWCLILPSGGATPQRAPQLYVKPDDRWEVNNLIAQHAEAAEHLELTLRRFTAAVQADRLAEIPALREELLKTAQ